MAENRNNDVTFEIMEHIGVIDVVDGREEKWTGSEPEPTRSM